jgi:hypothetical protein
MFQVPVTRTGIKVNGQAPERFSQVRPRVEKDREFGVVFATYPDLVV